MLTIEKVYFRHKSERNTFSFKVNWENPLLAEVLEKSKVVGPKNNDSRRKFRMPWMKEQ